MLLGRDFKQMTINVEGNTIEMISSVKLLGIHIDNKLSFNEHISKLCKKSANQIERERERYMFIQQQSVRRLPKA